MHLLEVSNILPSGLKLPYCERYSFDSFNASLGTPPFRICDGDVIVSSRTSHHMFRNSNDLSKSVEVAVRFCERAGEGAIFLSAHGTLRTFHLCQHFLILLLLPGSHRRLLGPGPFGISSAPLPFRAALKKRAHLNMPCVRGKRQIRDPEKTSRGYFRDLRGIESLQF